MTRDWILAAVNFIWIGNVWLIASAFAPGWSSVGAMIAGFAWIVIGGWIWKCEAEGLVGEGDS